MADVEEVRSRRSIGDPASYFRRYADHEGEAPYADKRTGFQARPPRRDWATQLAPEIENVTPERLEQRTIQQQRALRAREACLDGLRVLAYLVLADDVVSDEETNIEESYVEARLAMCGFDHDERIVSEMSEIARGLTVPSRSFKRALNTISQDRSHLKLILDAASRIAETVPVLEGTERKAFQQVLDVVKLANQQSPRSETID